MKAAAFRHNVCRNAVVPLVAVAATILAMATASESQASIAPVKALAGGFDTCTAPSSSTMDDWYTPSPYHWIGIYIGGGDRSCGQPNLTTSWVAHNSNTGWGFAPIYVGRQNGSGNSCGKVSVPYYISSSTSTAHDQGVTSADDAVSEATDLGFKKGSIIYLDLEAYSTGTSSCVASARSYVDAWDHELSNVGWLGGLYGSDCGSNLPDFTSSHISYVPVDIWAANDDHDSNTNDLSCVSSGEWSAQRRLKQYVGGHSATYGGDTLTIDSDCANGDIDDARTPNNPADHCT